MNDKLNILILTLSTGEEVIANLKDHVEKVDGVDKQVCYNMVYPFTLTRSGPIKNQQVGVVFTPWKFFSSDTSFLIGYDKILNMCTPLPNVVEQYKKAVDELIKSMAQQQ
jgi:hypothetical protein|tara:strand:- start:2283 stop:2612 length:330 start_codon:yes stop_codon:yes gene_type:complete